MPRREHGELFQRFLPILERAFVGTSVEDAVAPSQRYAVALHLRTLDFIEGVNATDAAAFEWLLTRKARFKWTCLVRRLRALGLGCAPGHRVFLAAVASWVEINHRGRLKCDFHAGLGPRETSVRTRDRGSLSGGQV